jgi:multiple sugar transport system ATP-binding protein
VKVDFRAVGKDYGTTATLRDINLTVPDGAFVALIGPSGCGKSTLLRMVAGLEHIDFGEISIGDRVINDTAPKNRGVAMVFQNYALYPHMTVRENLGFSLRMARLAPPQAKERIAEAARILGLEDLLDRYPRQLSGGQRQRVAMGRAIVRDPDVFLFDEPLSNLDAQLRLQMRAEIKRLHRTLGATVIFVTHDQVEAMTMADLVVVMRAGRIEQVGTPLELYDHPANAFVATFIGAPPMSLIRGEIGGSGAKCTLQNADGARILLGDQFRAAQELAEGQECLLGFRPEHVNVARAAEGAAGPAIFGGTVSLVESTGIGTHLIVTTDHGDMMAILRGRADLAPGDAVTLSLDLGQAHLFDAETGLRLGLAGRSSGLATDVGKG